MKLIDIAYSGGTIKGIDHGASASPRYAVKKDYSTPLWSDGVSSFNFFATEEEASKDIEAAYNNWMCEKYMEEQNLCDLSIAEQWY